MQRRHHVPSFGSETVKKQSHKGRMNCLIRSARSFLRFFGAFV